MQHLESAAGGDSSKRHSFQKVLTLKVKEMGVTLSDNSNTLYSSYLKGWETALKIYEEENGEKNQKGKFGKKKV